MENQSEQTQQERPNDGSEPRFVRAFLPGLIVGLVLGLFIGAFVAPLIDRGGTVSRDTGHRAVDGGMKPKSVHEPEVLPDGRKVGEPAAPNNAENKKTDLPDQPAQPAPPPGGG